ncbi:MAG: abortive infection system antitoxin AbiGi family protein [Chlorobium sp.]
MENNFNIRYTRERLIYQDDSYFDYLIPAICFCDIPLSAISDHIAEYGEYGIGLKRDWAYSNKLNPVIYYSEDSYFVQTFYELMNLLQEDNSSAGDRTRPLSKHLFHYYKPHTGYDFKNKEEKCFYDEREWRFVPRIDNNLDLIIHCDEQKTEFIEQLRNSTEKLKLEFQPNDISFIIIKDESERLKFIRKIKEIKGRYSHDDVEILTSKILTVERINKDI